MTIPNFKEKLQKYAELIVKIGVNVQPNQPVVLYINVEQQELAHLIVKEAYAAGASEVMVKWSDTFTSRQFLEFANQEITRLNKIPKQELKERIESKKEEYDTLSMVDSYILHRIISNFNHPRKLLNKEVFKTKSDLQDLSTEKKYIYVAKPAMHK